MSSPVGLIRRLVREYRHLLLESGAGGSLIIVDVQPEYQSNIGFDVGEMLQSALENYSKILVLWNGPDLSMSSRDDLVSYYYQSFLDAGGTDEDFEELLEKCTFYDKGYGFFRDLMDHPCFDEDSIVAIVEYMLHKDVRDIRELTSDDVEQIGIDDLLVDDLESYGFYVPDLKDVLPRWNGSDICGGSVDECLAEVEILARAMGLRFKRFDDFTY
jgi:hypothetical protein